MMVPFWKWKMSLSIDWKLLFRTKEHFSISYGRFAIFLQIHPKCKSKRKNGYSHASFICAKFMEQKKSEKCTFERFFKVFKRLYSSTKTFYIVRKQNKDLFKIDKYHEFLVLVWKFEIQFNFFEHINDILGVTVKTLLENQIPVVSEPKHK